MPKPCPPGVCSPAHGMPRWWVAEPYISLCMSDTPLSYTLSSGQEMDFRFYYCQRTEFPGGDEITYPNQINTSDQYSYPRGAYNNGSDCGTNASWGNNWIMSIQIWDTSWENIWDVPDYSGNHLHWPSYAPYSHGYQALVWRPEGGMNYFNVASNSLFAVDPQSQVKIMPVSTAGFPIVETVTTTGRSYMANYFNTINLGWAYTNSSAIFLNNPQKDTNSIYWGDAGVGVKLVYLDGSQDIFALSAYPMGVGVGAPPPGSSNPDTGVASTSRLLLTQKIDPQGRITSIGYEYIPVSYNPYYRVRYVVDPDGRTNTFQYIGTNNANGNGFLVKEIDDPYGRKTKVTSTTNASTVVPVSIVDAAGLTNTFSYPSDGSGWISSMTTPYGSTSFTYYDEPDPAPVAPNCFIQRAIYINEPTGAQQLYCYIHNNSNVASTDTAPSVSGQSFDDGTSGATGHYPLTYRNTYYWGRRQFASLSPSVQSYLSSGDLSDAIANLTATDFNISRMRHWLMLGSDDLSITEALSSERDPSPDPAGSIPGLRTWYNYAGKPGAELISTNMQAGCIAKVLPDGTSQYSTYNYYSQAYTNGGAGLASDKESSFSNPDGSIGVLTNWFRYANNNVDLLSVSNSAGQYVKYRYNGSHQITAVTNALNQVTTLSWDSSTFNLTGAQLPGGKSYTLTYYAAAPPLTNTSSLLQEISISPEGRTFTINSYSAGLPSNVTDDRGLTTGNTWDGLNRLTGTSFPDGTTVSNIYNRLDLVANKDRLNNWTHYSFDGLQHLVAVTNANNAVTSYSWCGCGSLNQIVDALNHTNTLNYDNQGNLTSVYFPDNSSITYQFDLAGRMTNAFDGAGRNVQLAYNNQGLPVTVTGANGLLRQTIYDAVNRPMNVTDANGISVTNSFDAINELLNRTWPDGISEGYGYSATGLVAYTNRDQKITRYGRDGAGRLTSVTNANSEVTQFGYDSLDNVNSLIDGLTHTTTWQYNEYGWLTNKTDGLNRTAFRYAYNANGSTTNGWTPEKGNTSYSYDNVGNLKSIIYPQQTNSFAYDALNRLTNMVDAVGTTAFSYTPAGRLQSENGPWTSDTVTFNYAQGLRTNLTLSQTTSNWSQSYGYDSGWRMNTITSPAGTFGYSYTFQPASKLVTGITLPNGANIVNSYDSLARLTGTALNDHWAHPLDSYTYTPDALGLRTNIVRNLGLTSSTVTAGFDNIGQLTSWNATDTGGALRQNEQLGFGYDAAHNLHTRNNGNLAQTFTTDAANELTGVTRTGTFTMSGATPAPATNVTVNGLTAQTYGDFTFAATNLSLVSGSNTFTNIAQNSYGVRATNIVTLNLPSSVTLNSDGNGNLTNNGSRAFGYDAENQLTNITLAGSWKSDFVYDGLNRRRIARDFSWQSGAWVLTNETHYIYDGRLLIQERGTNNNSLVTYTRGLDLSGSLHRAGGIGGLLARTDTNGSTFYHADGFGNITALIDARENIVARYLYNPFGKVIGQWGPLASVNVMQYSSKPAYRGIVDFGLRWYSPDLDRFLNQDPIQERGGINLYRFVKNNPLRFVDSFGLQIESFPEPILVDPYIPAAQVRYGPTTVADPTYESGNPLERTTPSGNRAGDGLAGAANLIDNAKENMERLGLNPKEGSPESNHSKNPCPNNKSNSPNSPINILPFSTDLAWSHANTNRPQLDLSYAPPAPPAPPGPNNIYANAPVVLPTVQPQPQTQEDPNWFARFAAWEATLQ